GDSEEFRERQKLLESFDFGTRSDPIYVFTNQGEIALQEDGSTALDFAYYVHTELGHHAVKIEVNGKPVPYNYPLHNGDLVHVHHDPHFIGPDLAWLGYVHTPSAKSKIRKGLATRARAIHEGRSKIEYVLIRMLQFYRKEKKYDLIINTSQLDTFLFRAAQAHGLLDRETLYTEVALGHISPHKLVQRLISEELSSTIVDNNGDAITVYP